MTDIYASKPLEYRIYVYIPRLFITNASYDRTQHFRSFSVFDLRDFSSLLSNTYRLNIGKINPLKHYVLSLSKKFYGIKQKMQLQI
jgi:hypothetical protein